MAVLSRVARFWCNGSLNLIVTGRENSSSEVEELRNRHCAVDLFPIEALLNILKQEVSPFLMADALVCFINVEESERRSPPTTSIETVHGERFVREIRRLPDSCAMPDGRKWKAVPIVMVLAGVGGSMSKDRIGKLAATECIAFVEAEQDFPPTFRAIEGAVREYRQRILAEFSNLGFLVSFRNGRYRVGPAMSATGDVEGFFYSSGRDQRDLRGRFFTVDRDPNGFQFEVEQFEALINREEAKEQDFQVFFEDNPHFLVIDKRISVPIPHVRLESQSGKLLIPDFVIKPIVAVKRDSSWQVLDLKKPGVPLLAGPRRHARLSVEVTQAMAQLRDYGDYFKNPENKYAVSKTLGHGLRFPELAVLIGRLRDCEVEELEKAQSREPDVRIVTYDEILQRQKMLVQ